MFQPLTELNGTKCKRCGIFEDDTFKYDTFDEWELCPSDFTAEGRYTHIKDKEFNATFLCRGCSQVGAGELTPSTWIIHLEQNPPGMIVIRNIIVLFWQVRRKKMALPRKKEGAECILQSLF